MSRDTRYSLARLVGLGLKDLFRMADAEPEMPSDRGSSDASAERLARVEKARQRLSQLVGQNPSVGRKQIIALDLSTVDILRRNAPVYYEAVMPARMRRGKNSSFNWAARDLEVHTIISDIAGDLGKDASSVAKILTRCGLSKRLFEKARGRLPWAKLLVASIVDSECRKHGVQTCFPFADQTQ